MSVKAMAMVWEADLNQREKFVLLAYADHADHEGNNVFPSVGLVAWKTGYTSRSIRRITKKLIADGILIHDGKSPYYTNKYRIALERLPKLPPYIRDDRMSGGIYGGDSLSGEGMTECQGGDKTTQGGVIKDAVGGDTAMSPEPSLTIKEPSRGVVASEFENNIQMLTPHSKEIIIDWEKHYSEDWIIEAIHIAVEQNVRKPKYINAILENWRDNGKDSRMKEPQYAEIH